MDLIPIYSIPLWQSEYPEFEEHKKIFLAAVKEYKKQTQQENLQHQMLLDINHQIHFIM